MLIQAAERTPGLAMEPRPFVLQKKLGDFAVTYELNVYCSDVPDDACSSIQRSTGTSWMCSTSMASRS